MLTYITITPPQFMISIPTQVMISVRTQVRTKGQAS